MKMRYRLLGLSIAASSVLADSLMLDSISIYDVENENSLNKEKVIIKEKKQSNNIADFLKDDPEITIKRKANYGDNGDTLLIRGQGGNRIALNLDGHNINSLGSLGGNYIDFGAIPMDNIDKIEVIKGGSSAEYGNILGGVINAYTKKPTYKPSFSIYGTNGGWDSLSDYYNIRTNFSQRFDKFGITIGASHQEADAYLWNNDYESDSVSARVYYFMDNEGELSAGFTYSDTTRGTIKSNRQSNDPTSSDYDKVYSSNYPLSSGESIAGASGANKAFSNIGEGANSNKKKYLYDIAYSQPLNKNIKIDLSAYHNSEDRTDKNYADTSLVKGTSLSDGDLVMERDVEVDRSYGVKAKSMISLKDHELIVGIEHKMLRSGENVITYLNTEYNGKAGGGGNKNNSVGVVNEGTDIALDALFLSDTWYLNEMLELNIGARYDKYDIDMPKSGSTFTQSESEFTPKLGLVYTPNEKNSFGVYIYQMYRAPGSTEANHYLDGVSAKTELADKSLKGEKADAIDLVYKHYLGAKTFFQTSLFYYDVDDYLIFKTPSSGGRYAYNVDNATFAGISVNGVYALNDDLTLRGGATYQKAQKEGDALDPNNTMDHIDYIPDYKLNGGFEWKLSAKYKADLGITYVGERYYQRTVDDVEKLSSYTVFDASIQYEVFKNAVVELYGENLGDKYYEEVFGYPSTGKIIGMSYKYVY